jgi:hypothetical protein
MRILSLESLRNSQRYRDMETNCVGDQLQQTIKKKPLFSTISRMLEDEDSRVAAMCRLLPWHDITKSMRLCMSSSPHTSCREALAPRVAALVGVCGRWVGARCSLGGTLPARGLWLDVGPAFKI